MTKKTKINKDKKKVTVKLRKQEKQSRYFLNELFVNNFKAIHGNERPINFGSRITLLFGKNSAGKSSIIQAIKLIQQSFENDNDLVLSPKKSYSGGLYFPSFKDLISKKDLTKSLTLGMTVNEHARYSHDSLKIEDRDENKKTIIKKFDIKNKEIICSEVDFYSTTDDKEKFISISNSPFYLKGLTGEKNYYKSKISFFENKFAFKELFENVFKNKKKILPYLDRSIDFRNKFLRILKEGGAKNSDRLKINERLTKLFTREESINRFSPINFRFSTEKNAIENHKKFISGMKNDYPSFLQYISNDTKKCKNFLYKNNQTFDSKDIDALLNTQLTHEETVNLNKVSTSDTSLSDYLCYVVSEINGYSDPEPGVFLGKTLTAPRMISFCNDSLSKLLRSIYVFQGQKALPHEYENVSYEEDFVGYNYEFLHKVIQSNKSDINRWLKNFGYDFKIETETGGPTNVTLIQHKKGKFKINYKYGGLGAENVLPVIAQSVAAKNKVLVFEEPERRAHPGLQVKLADLFVECSKNNQFIIETHSENLLLGILKNIRDGKISHKDVQVSYVYIDKDQAKIDEIKINEKGHFESSWRDGFFTERLDLI